jgi:acyl-CoA thioester hydrolase
VSNDEYFLAGTLQPNGHHLTQRVYYEDTDFSGFVYHARYLHFLERGRTDYLRCLGVEQGSMMVDGKGLAFVVRRMTIDYLRPARMDDILSITTRPVVVAGARLTLAQSIAIAGTAVIEARVEVAAVDGEGRARRFPTGLAQALRGSLDG